MFTRFRNAIILRSIIFVFFILFYLLRDLAARNVLIDEYRTLKISDFGLSRKGIYINTKTKKVPWRWLSIEAMRDNLYSTKSDVWAFAIVLWEIGTLGKCIAWFFVTPFGSKNYTAINLFLSFQ